MVSTLLLLSEIPLQQGYAVEAAKTWIQHEQPGRASERVIYQSLDQVTLLELISFDELSDLGGFTTAWPAEAEKLSPFVAGDWRRQILQFVEPVKPTNHALPPTPYLQLRHVEVKPPMYNEYRSWRERTIYEVVRNHSDVEVFLAYHSLLSTEPGVMFLSGFSCEPETYEQIFQSPEYQEIVSQAGNRYITGGSAGLYTKIYRRIDQRLQ